MIAASKWKNHSMVSTCKILLDRAALFLMLLAGIFLFLMYSSVEETDNHYIQSDHTSWLAIRCMVLGAMVCIAVCLSVAIRLLILMIDVDLNSKTVDDSE